MKKKWLAGILTVGMLFASTPTTLFAEPFQAESEQIVVEETEAEAEAEASAFFGAFQCYFILHRRSEEGQTKKRNVGNRNPALDKSRYAAGNHREEKP